MDTRIRKATKKDVEAMASLRREFQLYFQKELKLYLDVEILTIKENQRHLINFLKRKQSKIFIAEVDKKIIGYIKGHVFEDDFDLKRYGNIDEIIVYQDYRGKGIAGMLEKEIESYLQKYKINGIYSNVHTNNKSSLKFHLTHGFKIISTEYTLFKTLK